jgi:hypothetical protein
MEKRQLVWIEGRSRRERRLRPVETIYTHNKGFEI